jgi:hypothetical protein
MMKAKVLIPFKDKETKKEHKKNDIIDVSAKRFNEITTKGRYIELVEETTAPETKK